MASSSKHRVREERAEPSHLRKHAGFSKKDIFLSHSGYQKDFVENLYYALERANQKAFMDKYSLRKASRFPPDIMTAVEDSELGVVVLSDQYFNSKWPMLELAMLFQKGKKVLPLFFELDIPDLKCNANLSQWKQRWEDMVNQGEVRADQVKEWEGLVQQLPSINGIVFKRQGSENAYIKMVVDEICKLVTCHVQYDLSSIYGREELAKEIRAQFDAGCCEEVRMVGLYGVGGQGKTTLCKTMVNFYSSQYSGRCCLIEFPTIGNKAEVLQVCKEALMTLANLSGHVLERIHSFEQVIHEMKEHVIEHDVFLAVDNVWLHSVDEAEALLNVGFTAASKILLTSRSEKVLRNLLSGHIYKNSYIGTLPAPEQEVAFQIFENSLKLGDEILPDRYRIYALLEKCRFNGEYHPLALKAMGQYVRKCLDGRVHNFDRVLEEINIIHLESVHKAIELNYHCLSKDMQYMFLDIALWVECRRYYPLVTESWEEFPRGRVESIMRIRQWLCHLYNEISKTKITRSICELAEAGVILREVDEVGQQTIQVHDLYLQLAEREADMSERVLNSTKAVEGSEWEKLERVITLEDGKSSQFIEKLQKHKCPKVKFLCAQNFKVSSEIHMESLPSLRILMLGPDSLRSDSSRIDVSGCPQLEFVFLQKCRFVKRLDGLYALLNLQILVIKSCSYLENFHGLGCLTKLKILNVQQCNSLMNLPDVGGALKKLKVCECLVLKRLMNLGGATGLERLELDLNISLEEVDLNNSLEEVVGCASASLKELTVTWCKTLKKLPDLGGVTGLERLELHWNESLEEVVGCLSAGLKELTVTRCKALKKLPDLGGATGLERLELHWNESLEEVVGCPSAALKELTITWCKVLKKLPDLGGATGLERLKLDCNEALEEVVGCTSALKELTVTECNALKKLPDLGDATGLERLELDRNESLEEVVGCAGATLKELTVQKCKALKKLPGLGVATGLEKLMLDWNESLEEVVGCASAALKELRVRGCKALKKLPNLGGATGLERMVLSSNDSLEEVVACPSAALKKLTVESCKSLKKLPDLGGATGLESLELWGNDSLEEVVVGPSAALKELVLTWDARLQKMLQGRTGLHGHDILKPIIVRKMPSRKESVKKTKCTPHWHTKNRAHMK